MNFTYYSLFYTTRWSWPRSPPSGCEKGNDSEICILATRLYLCIYQSMAVIYIPKSLSGQGIEPQPMHEIINPSYSPATRELSTQTEGCYSVRYDVMMAIFRAHSFCFLSLFKGKQQLLALKKLLSKIWWHYRSMTAPVMRPDRVRVTYQGLQLLEKASIFQILIIYTFNSRQIWWLSRKWGRWILFPSVAAWNRSFIRQPFCQQNCSQYKRS